MNNFILFNWTLYSFKSQIDPDHLTHLLVVIVLFVFQ